MWCLFFKHTTAYDMRISDWSSDVCSTDLLASIGDICNVSDLWGSGDAYNTVEFLGAGGVVLAAFSGSDIFNPANGSQTDPNLNPLVRFDLTGSDVGALPELRLSSTSKIGRASCRERVCQYV